MIRVDHAGEYGAMRIYQGQFAVLEAFSADAKAVAAIRRMAEQESRHLERFEQLLNERQGTANRRFPLFGMRPDLRWVLLPHSWEAAPRWRARPPSKR